MTMLHCASLFCLPLQYQKPRLSCVQELITSATGSSGSVAGGSAHQSTGWPHSRSCAVCICQLPDSAPCTQLRLSCLHGVPQVS